MVLNDLRLSLPCDRSMFTRHARPSLASQAPIDSIKRVASASESASIKDERKLNIIIPSIINSRFRRAIKNLLWEMASKIRGRMVNSGIRERMWGM